MVRIVATAKEDEMSALEAVYPRDQVFKHGDRYFVLGKQDGTSYSAYPVVMRRDTYCKDTSCIKHFSAFDIAGKRLSEAAHQIGPAYVMLEEYLWRSQSACES